MESKTGAELEQMILAEVRDLAPCKGLEWISIVPVGTTWRADMCGGDPTRQAECVDAINSVVHRLRAQYLLSTEGASAESVQQESAQQTKRSVRQHEP
jgi:hypothetical protein